MGNDRIELGVSLLAVLERETLSLSEAIDRIEVITTDPETQRRILDRAEEQEIIERGEASIRLRSSRFVRFGSDVTQKEGEFTCRRCGAGLQTGFFIELDGGELGPFGSSCIRKVTGRE